MNKEHNYVPCEYILLFTCYYFSFHSTQLPITGFHFHSLLLFCSNFIYQLIVHYSECVYIYTDMYRNL